MAPRAAGGDRVVRCSDARPLSEPPNAPKTGQVVPFFLWLCQSPRNEFHWPRTWGFSLNPSKSPRSLLRRAKPSSTLPRRLLSILEHGHETNPQTQAREQHGELTRNELGPPGAMAYQHVPPPFRNLLPPSCYKSLGCGWGATMGAGEQWSHPKPPPSAASANGYGGVAFPSSGPPAGPQ